jgi:hypothetical protein
MNAPTGVLDATARGLDLVEATFDDEIISAPKVGWQVLSGANTVVRVSWEGDLVSARIVEPEGRSSQRERLLAAAKKYRVIRSATKRAEVTGKPADLLVVYRSYEASIVEAEKPLR